MKSVSIKIALCRGISESTPNKMVSSSAESNLAIAFSLSGAQQITFARSESNASGSHIQKNHEYLL